jgi:hypothetical protein
MRMMPSRDTLAQLMARQRQQGASPVSMRGNNPAPPQLSLPPKAEEGWYQGPAYPPLQQRIEDYLKALPTPPPTTSQMAPPSMPGGGHGGYPLEGRTRMDSLPGNDFMPGGIPGGPMPVPAVPYPQWMPSPPMRGEIPRLTPEQLDVILGKPAKKIEIMPIGRQFDI